MPNHHATHNKKKNKKPKYKPNQAGHQANNQANNQASKQANNQASKQANNQAHNQAGKQANNQANNQAHNQSNKQAHNQSNKQVQQSASFTETFVMCPGLSFRDELREVGDAILPCECSDLLNVDNLVELAKYAPSFYARLPEQLQKNATLCEAVLDAHNGNDDMLAKVLAVQDDYDADSALGKKLCQVCALNPSSLSQTDLRDHRQFVLDAIAKNHEVMKHIGFELREDFNFVLQCIVHNFDALSALDEDMLEDDDYKEHHRLKALRTLRNAHDVQNLLSARLFAEKKQQAQQDQERLDGIAAYHAYYNNR